MIATLLKNWFADGDDRYSRLRSETGETLVEFAFASVMFLTIIFGTIEFGLVVWRYNMISDLAQEGARWASVRGRPAAAVAHASSADVQTFVEGRATGISVTVTTTPAPSTIGPPQTVSVQVSTPFTVVFPQATFTLQSTAQMTMSR